MAQNRGIAALSFLSECPRRRCTSTTRHYNQHTHISQNWHYVPTLQASKVGPGTNASPGNRGRHHQRFHGSLCLQTSLPVPSRPAQSTSRAAETRAQQSPALSAVPNQVPACLLAGPSGQLAGRREGAAACSSVHPGCLPLPPMVRSLLLSLPPPVRLLLSLPAPVRLLLSLPQKLRSARAVCFSRGPQGDPLLLCCAMGRYASSGTPRDVSLRAMESAAANCWAPEGGWVHTARRAGF